MKTRTYVSGDRTFEITLNGAPREMPGSWTITHVFERSLNEEICVSGIAKIEAATEETAFAHACDCIDKSSRPRI